jgi:hypothetical protein
VKQFGQNSTIMGFSSKPPKIMSSPIALYFSSLESTDFRRIRDGFYDLNRFSPAIYTIARVLCGIYIYQVDNLINDRYLLYNDLTHFINYDYEQRFIEQHYLFTEANGVIR